MAKRLTMAEIDTILTLHKSRHSNREIAALLGVNRETVGRHLARAKAEIQPNAPTGNPADGPPPVPTGGDGDDGNAGVPANQPNAPTDSESPPASGPRSECEPFRELILAKVEQGLEAVRIHQDLVAEHGQGVPSYYSVRRFIARLRHKTPLPFRRMETAPSEEAQVDFGTGATVIRSDGKRRRPWMFRIVLSYSRKGYSEAVWRQSSEAFIACLENAFRHFGGAPKRLVIDNLKAVVTRGDWYDPEVHPKLQSFARHYGTAFMPTRPYMPRHKGKIESGVKYAKRNALKGRTFTSLADENEFLLHWETQIADQRIHGTTKRQVAKLFTIERGALLPLPLERFPFFHEAHRAVHRDGHLEVDKAKAAQRGIDAHFLVGNALELDKLGRQFDTVIDCGLFHTFSDEERQTFIRSLTEVLGAGGTLFLLCFSDAQPGSEGPRRVSQQEIRDAFRDGWNVKQIEPTHFESILRPLPSGILPDSADAHVSRHDLRIGFLHRSPSIRVVCE